MVDWIAATVTSNVKCNRDNSRVMTKGTKVCRWTYFFAMQRSLGLAGWNMDRDSGLTPTVYTMF
jgi:hypothetical protein